MHSPLSVEVASHRWRLIAVSLAAILLALGMTATALAGDPNNNSLRSQAEPVQLEADDINIVEFGDFYYVAINHGLGSDPGYDSYLWCEPVRLGGAADCTVDDPLTGFDTLYLGVAGPDGGEVPHKGQVSVYYDMGEDGGWKSIVAQFNGKGELIHVNGVRLEE